MTARKRLVISLGLFSLATGGLDAQVQEQIQFLNVDSNGSLNDPSNSLRTFTAVGGYPLGRINFSGTLASVAASTWRTDARVLVRAPSGAEHILQPFTTGTTFTTSSVNGFFYLDYGGNPAGEWSFRFFEIADDGGPAVVDARWNTITFVISNTPASPPPSTNLQTLLAPGHVVSGATLSNNAVLWYRFTLPWGISTGIGTHLDIDTFGSLLAPTGSTPNDTQIALYDSQGQLVATDDDTGPGYTSQLSFGAGMRPGRPGGDPFDGRNGSLPPGTYYLAVASYRLTVRPSLWQVTPNAISAGQITVNFTTDMTLAYPGCYANCDVSTTTPVLNVADFTCFLQRFAAVDLYANCDLSTAAPVLNVADFTCFLQQFAAGCP